MDESANGCNHVQMQEKNGNDLKSRWKDISEFFVSCCNFYVSLRLFQSKRYPKNDIEEVRSECAMITPNNVSCIFSLWRTNMMIEVLHKISSKFVSVFQTQAYCQRAVREFFDACTFIDTHLLLKKKFILSFNINNFWMPLCSVLSAVEVEVSENVSV